MEHPFVVAPYEIVPKGVDHFLLTAVPNCVDCVAGVHRRAEHACDEHVTPVQLPVGHVLEHCAVLHQSG
jgi:hypothetical protein